MIELYPEAPLSDPEFREAILPMWLTLLWIGVIVYLITWLYEKYRKVKYDIHSQ